MGLTFKGGRIASAVSLVLVLGAVSEGFSGQAFALMSYQSQMPRSNVYTSTTSVSQTYYPVVRTSVYTAPAVTSGTTVQTTTIQPAQAAGSSQPDAALVPLDGVTSLTPGQ